MFETVVDDAPTLDLAKAIDIVMLAMTGGRERTRSEHARLLGRAGFTVKRLRPTSGPYSIIEALVEAPTFAAWLDVLEPITQVFQLAGLQNSMRRLVVDGVPVATGLHAIGDAVCTTNPTLGRGQHGTVTANPIFTDQLLNRIRIRHRHHTAEAHPIRQ